MGIWSKRLGDEVQEVGGRGGVEREKRKCLSFLVTSSVRVTEEIATSH